MTKKIKYEESSGNIFADLSSDNSEEKLAKAELTRQIAKIIKKRKLTQKQAAEILGIDQPKISALIRGRLHSFSLERLIRYLNVLGQDVRIMISPTKSQSERGHTWISESHSNTRIAARGR